MSTIDPKAAAGTLGAALGPFIWFLLAKFDAAGIGGWSTEEIIYAGGVTTVILTFVLAYMVPNGESAGRKRG